MLRTAGEGNKNEVVRLKNHTSSTNSYRIISAILLLNGSARIS